MISKSKQRDMAGWGGFPRFTQSGIASPKDPICMDASAYSLADRRTGGETEFVGRIAGDVAMGCHMYRRPSQKMHVLCSSKVIGNVEHVARALESLTPELCKHIRVLVHDGVYNNSGHDGAHDSYSVIATACESSWLTYQTHGLKNVQIGYVFSRAHPNASKFAEQMSALCSAHAAGHIRFVWLATPRPGDFAAAIRVLRAAGVPVRGVIVHPSSHSALELSRLSSSDLALIPKFSFDQPLALRLGATHISSSRRGYDHMRNWSSATFNQPPVLVASV